MSTNDALMKLMRDALASKRETLRSLADKTEVPWTTIADWEKGRSVPPLDRAERLAVALGAEMWLVTEPWKHPR